MQKLDRRQFLRIAGGAVLGGIAGIAAMKLGLDFLLGADTSGSVKRSGRKEWKSEPFKSSMNQLVLDEVVQLEDGSLLLLPTMFGEPHYPIRIAAEDVGEYHQVEPYNINPDGSGTYKSTVWPNIQYAHYPDLFLRPANDGGTNREMLFGVEGTLHYLEDEFRGMTELFVDGVILIRLCDNQIIKSGEDYILKGQVNNVKDGSAGTKIVTISDVSSVLTKKEYVLRFYGNRLYDIKQGLTQARQLDIRVGDIIKTTAREILAYDANGVPAEEQVLPAYAVLSLDRVIR